MLTYLGKNKGIPANQKGREKIRDKNEKICTPGKLKTRRATWEKKGIPVD